MIVCVRSIKNTKKKKGPGKQHEAVKPANASVSTQNATPISTLAHHSGVKRKAASDSGKVDKSSKMSSTEANKGSVTTKAENPNLNKHLKASLTEKKQGSTSNLPVVSQSNQNSR